MKTFYVGLCRSLIGNYVVFEAEEEYIVREHLLKYYGNMWCSIYNQHDWDERVEPKLTKYALIGDGTDSNGKIKPIRLYTAEWE